MSNPITPGPSPRAEEAMLAYQFGYVSFARLAEEFGHQPTTVTLASAGEHFTALEMADLMAALDLVIARRRGELPNEWRPDTLPADWTGRCGNPACESCRGEVGA